VPPVTTTQYSAWIFLGLVSLLGAVTFVILMYGNKHTFDRNTDKFLRRQKLVSRITDIHHLRIYKEKIEGKTMCFLAVVFNTRKPYLLGHQPLPGEELTDVARRIASYLNLEVVNEI